MKILPNSYNCFYSAIFDILKPKFEKNTHLLINNRWQFFFNPKLDYTDDLRPIGEHPILYDEKHFSMLKDALGIDIRLMRIKKSSLDDFKQVINQQPVIIFANKIYFVPNITIGLRRCVSTIMVKGNREENIICKTYDNDLVTLQNIKIDELYNSWKFASDLEQLNEGYIKILFDTSPTETDIINFARKCMRDSLEDYINSVGFFNTSEKIFIGVEGIIEFATQLTDGVGFNSQMLIDCSMYLDIVIRQRKQFALSLESVINRQEREIIVNINDIIEQWQNVKILLFIIGTRKQENSLAQIRPIMNKLILDEIELVKKIKMVL